MILGNQAVHQSNVLLLSIFLGSTLQLVPRFPLVFTFEVKDTWLGGVIVTNSGLLVKTIKFEQFIVGWSAWQVRDGISLKIMSVSNFGTKREELQGDMQGGRE